MMLKNPLGPSASLARLDDGVQLYVKALLQASGTSPGAKVALGW